MPTTFFSRRIRMNSCVRNIRQQSLHLNRKRPFSIQINRIFTKSTLLTMNIAHSWIFLVRRIPMKMIAHVILPKRCQRQMPMANGTITNEIMFLSASLMMNITQNHCSTQVRRYHCENNCSSSVLYISHYSSISTEFIYSTSTIREFHKTIDQHEHVQYLFQAQSTCLLHSNVIVTRQVVYTFLLLSLSSCFFFACCVRHDMSCTFISRNICIFFSLRLFWSLSKWIRLDDQSNLIGKGKNSSVHFTDRLII
jgi:hypothetical protein